MEGIPPNTISGDQMSNIKSSSFKVLLEDIKVSFKFAVKNVISFTLGMIGVLVATGMLIALVAALIFIPLFLIFGPGAMITFFESLAVSFGSSDGALIMGAFALLMIPLMAPLFVAIGALFGMGREIVESAGTSVEGVFQWYKRKFFSLAGGGIILFIFILGPLALAIIFVGLVTGDFTGAIYSSSAGGLTNGVLSAITFVWLILSTGSLSMLFPGIIDGLSVIEATKQSFRMAWTYFDRIFSVLIAFLVILMVLIAPMYAMSLVAFQGMDLILITALSVIALPLGLILLFLWFPAFVIALSRVYMILSGEDIPEVVDETPDVSLVGGS